MIPNIYPRISDIGVLICKLRKLSLKFMKLKITILK